jgi:hypothetical protein
MIYPHQWSAYGYALRFAAVFGAVFGSAAGAAMLGLPLAGALFGLVSGVLDATAVMAFIGALEIFLFVPRTRLGQALGQRTFLATVFAK